MSVSSASLIEELPLVVKRCRHGLFMFSRFDVFIGQALDLYGEFSELESALFFQLIKPGMTVLDVGANIGAHTVGMAKAVGSSGRVIAFEPQRIIHQMLCGNLALNNIENVSTCMVALGKDAGSVVVPKLLYKMPNNFGGISMETSGEGEAVPLITLDSLNLPQCHLIKIDVEGMELDVLKGASQTLARCQPFLYVENDRREKSEALIHALLDMNYRLYWHLPRLFNPDNFFGNSTNIFEELASINMLCVPPSLPHFVVDSSAQITRDNAAIHPLGPV